MKIKVGFAIAATLLVVALLFSGISQAQSPNGIRGWFSGSVGLSSVYKFIFGDNVSTDVTLSKGAANTLTLGPVGGHLGETAANKDFAGTCAIGSTCVVTFVNAYATAPVCVGTDVTGANAVRSAPSTSGVTFTGTGTDTVAYICIGNPN